MAKPRRCSTFRKHREPRECGLRRIQKSVPKRISAFSVVILGLIEKVILSRRTKDHQRHQRAVLRFSRLNRNPDNVSGAPHIRIVCGLGYRVKVFWIDAPA